MYISTFYSFKGGVGRTMALVNVAVELARRGRRVIAVDFDLEAPGLDTFNLVEDSSSTPGMIDFVDEYFHSGQVPDATEYLAESKGFESDSGRLWIMPSGAQQDNYARKFAGINWGELYDRHDGYLLFEDLKLQWKKRINPDYVLIDSRTGHTDIGGICTRQMPNSVVILFFPNAQNLRGLTKVVRDIRSEAGEPRNRAINLHFVMSNVPDLDDEDNILAESLQSFRDNLGFVDDPLIIHRYDSLSLLNQVIFTKDRPKSRLSREYNLVVKELMRNNPSDRDGALDYLESIDPIPSARKTPESLLLSPRAIEKHIDSIETNHKSDGEILFRLSLFRSNDGSIEDSINLLNRAIESGYRKPEVYLRRAHFKRREFGDEEGAIEDVVEALKFPDLSFVQVRQSLALLPPERLHVIRDSRAIEALPLGDRSLIGTRLDKNRYEAELAVAILSPLLHSPEIARPERDDVTNALSLAFIAIGRFSEAVQLILDMKPDLDKMEIHFAFNYGMALWGCHGDINSDAFKRVLHLAQEEPTRDRSPNYLQCLAVSHWATGDADRAREIAENARLVMDEQGGQEFSCWRYLRISTDLFKSDVEDLIKMVNGDNRIKPHFISQPLRDM